MKLQILSDLHIDSYARQSHPMGHIPKTEADLVLVAGDTANSDSGMPWLQEQAARLQVPVVTIAGNHEYFSEDVLHFDKKLATWDNYNTTTCQGLRFLQCQYMDVGDVRILGCTLWTDYQYQADEDTMMVARRFMRDYKQIYAGYDLFSPEVSIQIHAKQRQWLQQALMAAKTLGKKTVVMSHHSISPLSVSEKYANLPSNAAFVSDLSAWMYESWAPTLWVHGHTHEAFDYQIHNTRVLVNPRAYPNEVSSTEIAFAWDKVIEI
ncbi:metallophosphoesterase family protein [Psychrobacter sp. F1192]|uniref:Metallophosphoesterase family protein n=1 Tax=Psychrobacter coccoides TaxID=2818440 RepID=A0ABS3NKM2_9GAMM|nr:metallophosphoesterase [Psychrobacter coccoides]MBO1529957.1 metallophosphoesterase family protein [Psychrobacter coccoides]